MCICMCVHVFMCRNVNIIACKLFTESLKFIFCALQFPLPHSRGSSHGQSRITRYAYPEDFYVKMMVDAYCMWSTLEQENGTNIFKYCSFSMIIKCLVE